MAADAASAALFRRIHPKEFHARFLAEGTRPDGRRVDAHRPTLVVARAFAAPAGSALVRLGQTTVACGVTVEVAQPRPDRPRDGFVVVGVELPALCGPEFRPGPPPYEAQLLAAHIDAMLKLCGTVAPSDLCLVPDKLALVLRIDCIGLDHNGNLLDAFALAVAAALASTRLPAFDSGDLAKVASGTARSLPQPMSADGAPLRVGLLPFPSTCAIMEGETVVADPTVEEEELAAGRVLVVVDSNGRIRRTVKTGGAAVSEDALARCHAAAVVRAAEMDALVRAALARAE